MLLCLFSPAEPPLGLLAGFVLACLACGFPAATARGRLPRILWTLPPLALLAVPAPLPARILLALGWAYFALSFALDRSGMEYWAYKRAFTVIAAIALGASFLVAAAKTMQVGTPGGVLGFAAGAIVLGLYTLRAIRMGVTTDPGWKAYSALELIVPPAAGGAIAGALFLLLRHGEKLFAVLIAAPFAFLVSLVTTLFSAIFSGRDLEESPSNVNEIVPPETFDPPPTGTPAAPSQEALDASSWIDAHPVPWLGILITLVLIAALVLAVRYLRRSRSARDEASSALREEKFRVFRRRARRAPARENAARVRELYQSYLAYVQTHGRVVRSSDTSEEILLAAAAAPEPQEHPAEEETLRALYIRARYGDGETIRAEDVAAAEACLRVIRGD